MNYWYAARNNEMFLDLDSRKSLLRAMKIVRVCNWWKAVYHFPTQRAGHCHVVLVMRPPRMTDRDRAELALWMGSDKLRACFVFHRIACDIRGDLLVTNSLYHRKPDAVCECVEKHKEKSVTWACPALRKLLGDRRSSEWFPRAGRERMTQIRIPVGRVPLKLIRGWKRAR